jgi:hypothetical protein
VVVSIKHIQWSITEKIKVQTFVFVGSDADYFHLTFGQYPQDFTSISAKNFIIPPLPEGGGGYTVLPLSVLPSVQDIFRRIFLVMRESITGYKIV